MNSRFRVAFFSPMPPSKSGIADYSAALVPELGRHVDMKIFDADNAGHFHPDDHDLAIYHIGNNPWHTFAYETALRHPGVVVMHEANLHHLIAETTIRRGDWDAYLAECELNGGPEALAFALRVKALEVGPDYEGVAMTRRLLDTSKGLIVHSRFVASEMREQGYRGPISVIPHGAWIPDSNRNATRHLLGVDESAPVIGAFGYIKPYKRIAESLRALRRVVRLEPRIKMILAGEPHPEFPVMQLIRTLGLADHVRVLGFVPIEKFVDYMSACDIILNLRFPTVGETSGSLQRAFGLGKAVIVSDVGSFSELPDDICLKVPVGPHEEDLIFEYLNLLVSRPDLADAMGARAKEWVERECNWGVVAKQYADFLQGFADGRIPEIPVSAEDSPSEPEIVAAREPEVSSAEPPIAPADKDEKPHVDATAFEPWIAPEARDYAALHSSRFVKTLEMTPPGDAAKSILEMGAYMQMTPALKFQLGYGHVRGCYYGTLGKVDHKKVVSDKGQDFECDVDHFDAEKDVFPYPDESFDTVLCCELIEHLPSDPMHMMSEINRVLKPNGHLLLTTPNIGSQRAISAILLGYHPSFFPAYIRPRKEGEEAEARHNREYVPMEIQHLLTNSGFELLRLETGEFLDEPHPELGWIYHMLERYRLRQTLRGDGIYALGRKTGPIQERWPDWLYS